MVNDLFIKISGDNIPSTLQRISSLWKERVLQHPFEFHFLDDDYDHLYVSEKRTAQIFSLFSSVAIVLACMGLFALAAYSTIQRTSGNRDTQSTWCKPFRHHRFIINRFYKIGFNSHHHRIACCLVYIRQVATGFCVSHQYTMVGICIGRHIIDTDCADHR